jgi:fibronectin type 3 domain-containing protein
MADLNPEVFEDLQVAETSRPLFEAAGLPLRTWEAYALAFNERNLLRREIHRIREGRGASSVHPEVLERLQALRNELDPIVGELRKFLPSSAASSEERERHEMVLGFIAVSPTARDVAAKWITDPARYRPEAEQKLQLIEQVVEKYRRALRAEIDAQMIAPPPSPPLPQTGPVTQIMRRADAPLAPKPPALSAPTSLEAASSNGEVSLIWSAVPGAAVYVVKRAATKDGPYRTVARPAQDCYADTDLQNGTSYYYTVAAVDTGGAEGPPSPEVEATPMAPPLAPSGLVAVPGNHRVALSWNPSAGAARYKLLRSTTPAGPFTAVVACLETTYIDTTISNGTTYFYSVVASNGAGESPASPQAQAMPVAPPPPPVGLIAIPGNGRVALSWTAVHGATCYTVRRAMDPAGPYATIAGPPVPTCIDSGVANGTTYYYAVSALNPGGESIPGAAVPALPIGAPEPPAGLFASAGNGEVHLTWSSVSGASSYAVRRAPSADGPWTLIANPAGPAYTDTGLANGTAAFYTVSALNAGGESARSESISDVPVAPPPVPTGLVAVPGNTRITLGWTATPGATSYVLRRGPAPGGPHETIATPATNSHPDVLLSNDTTYYYTVAAKNAGGESTPSAEVAATPLGPPEAPEDVEAESGNGRVMLHWTPVGTADRYRVMRGTSPGGPYAPIAEPQEPSYIDADVINGMSYYYVIRASNEGGKGPYSIEVQASPVVPPSVPTGLSATPGNGTIALLWTPSADASSYTVHRAASADGPFTALATPATPSAIDAQVTNGTTYFYAVSARNAGGESALSATVSTIPHAPPGAPSGLSATPGNGQVSLAWSISPRAAGYSVRRSTNPAGPFEAVGSSSTATYTDASVTNGTTYHFVVTALNPGGESAPSTPVTATPVAPPPPPTGLQLSAGNGRVSLTWSPAPRATSYSVRRATSPGGPYAAIAAPALPSHVDAEAANGTRYRYVIAAVNAGGESAESAEASATPLATPGPVSALEAAPGNGQVSLHWPAAENATSYVVKRSLESEGTFTQIATVKDCHYVDAGLTNGTPYHYRVHAVNAGGPGGDSGTATATPVAPPAPPSALTATPGNLEVNLTWASSARATNYIVKRAQAPGGPYAEVATVVGTGHQDGGLSNGTTYYYIVTAANAGGESMPSAEALGTPVDAPEAPTNVTATSGNNQVLISWAAVPGATYYQVRRATNKRGPYLPAANVSRLSAVDNGVENGTAYYYVVHALNAGGRSAHSTRVSATPVPPPPPPGHVTVLPGNSRVVLTWEAVKAASGYSIKRSTSPNGPYSTIARVTQTSYLDSGVTNGTTYYYVVRSAAGVIKGALSAQVQATPSAPPLAPATPVATPGHGTISLSWNPSPGATGYHVKRAASLDGPYETIASPEAPAWEDIGLANGTTYHYRVSAENPGGESPDSQAVTASPVAPPAVPTRLQAHPASGEVTLAWGPVAGAVQYRVKRSASHEGPFAPIAEPAEAGYTDTGLSNGTIYHYVVSALNAHGESFDSSPTEATPVDAPAAPLGVTAMPGSSKIDLAWTPVPFALRYRVMRSGSAGGPYLLIASPRDAHYSDYPLTNGIPQYYVVSAVNAGGESPAGAEVSAAPLATGLPIDLKAVPGRPAEAKAPKADAAASIPLGSSPGKPPSAAEDIPTLESIAMPAGSKMQGIDLERLLDLRRVEQLRSLFEDTAQKFEEWEVLTLIAEEGYETRKTMELLIRYKNQGNAESFTAGAVALFEKVLRIRAQFGIFVRKLRAYLEQLEVRPPSRPVLEIALGFILQAARGRGRAEKWVEEPDVHRKAASEYMKMAYTIAAKYQDAL